MEKLTPRQEHSQPINSTFDQIPEIDKYPARSPKRKWTRETNQANKHQHLKKRARTCPIPKKRKHHNEEHSDKTERPRAASLPSEWTYINSDYNVPSAPKRMKLDPEAPNSNPSEYTIILHSEDRNKPAIRLRRPSVRTVSPGQDSDIRHIRSIKDPDILHPWWVPLRNLRESIQHIQRLLEVPVGDGDGSLEDNTQDVDFSEGESLEIIDLEHLSLDQLTDEEDNSKDISSEPASSDSSSEGGSSMGSRPHIRHSLYKAPDTTPVEDDTGNAACSKPQKKARLSKWKLKISKRLNENGSKANKLDSTELDRPRIEDVGIVTETGIKSDQMDENDASNIKGSSIPSHVTTWEQQSKVLDDYDTPPGASMDRTFMGEESDNGTPERKLEANDLCGNPGSYEDALGLWEDETDESVTSELQDFPENSMFGRQQVTRAVELQQLIADVYEANTQLSEDAQDDMLQWVRELRSLLALGCVFEVTVFMEAGSDGSECYGGNDLEILERQMRFARYASRKPWVAPDVKFGVVDGWTPAV